MNGPRAAIQASNQPPGSQRSHPERAPPLKPAAATATAATTATIAAAPVAAATAASCRRRPPFRAPVGVKPWMRIGRPPWIEAGVAAADASFRNRRGGRPVRNGRGKRAERRPKAFPPLGVGPRRHRPKPPAPAPSPAPASAKVLARPRLLSVLCLEALVGQQRVSVFLIVVGVGGVTRGRGRGGAHPGVEAGGRHARRCRSRAGCF